MKRAKEAQGKQTGPGCSRENKWDKGARMGQRSPKAMKQVKDAQKNKMGQRSPKVIKWAEDVQKNKMGQRSSNGTEEPKSDEMGQGSPKQHEYKPNDSTGLLKLGRRKVYNRPKRGKVCNKHAFGWQQQNHHPHEEKLFLATLGGSWIYRKKENDLPKKSKGWNNKPVKRREKTRQE